MDVEFLRGWVGFLLSVLSLAGVVWALLQSPAKKNADELQAFKGKVTDDIGKLDTRLDTAEKAISTIETVIKQLPDKDSFHALDKGLTEVRGKIDTITATLSSAGHSLERIEGFLINSATKG